ncbi:MAG: DUF5317 domain-containing protein [Saccharofermentanales bacterium]
MLFETLIVALVAGLIFGGSIRNLTGIHLHWPGFLFAGAIIRYVPHLLNRIFPFLFNKLDQNYGIALTTAAAAFFVASYVFLIAGVAVNLKEWTMYIILAGIVMNFIVVGENGGFMPVSAAGLAGAGYPMSRIVDGVIDLNHIITTDETRFLLLSDIFVVTRPYPFPKLLSIGDLVMCAGLFIFMVRKLLGAPFNTQGSSKSPKHRAYVDKLRV